MRTIRFFSPLALLALGSSGTASVVPSSGASATADPVVARILELGEKDNRVQEHLRILCKTIGPRLTGTAGYDRAANWAVERFQSFGLEARLETWGEFPMRFERGYSTGGMVEPSEVDYAFITSAWTPGTGGPKRGPALLEPTSEEALEAMKPRLAGAWIVNTEPAPPAKLRR